MSFFSPPPSLPPWLSLPPPFPQWLCLDQSFFSSLFFLAFQCCFLNSVSGLQEKLGQKDEHHFYLFKVILRFRPCLCFGCRQYLHWDWRCDRSSGCHCLELSAVDESLWWENISYHSWVSKQLAVFLHVWERKQVTCYATVVRVTTHMLYNGCSFPNNAV